MSTESKPNKDRTSQWGRRTARLSRPGTALTARGEPTLWLTAGALAIALFMIFGLVSLVVIMGGRTFWPDRLTQVELADGRSVLGNIIETESHLLTQAELEALPTSVRSGLKDQAVQEVTRTLFRTDNKQLTGETYRWVDNVLISGRMTYPEWATTIERTSWGRFLGTPDAFIVRTPRRPTGTEEQLAKLISFFEENRTSVDEAQQSVVDKAIDRLRGEFEQVRQRATSAFIEMSRSSTRASEQIALLESGEETPLAEVAASNAVVGIREVWSGPENSWEQYLARHDEVRSRTKRIRVLDEHHLGRLSDQVEDARMQTVRAGLSIGEPLEPAARQLAELDAAVSALKAQRDSLQQILDTVKRTFGQTGELVPIADKIVQTRDQEIQTQIASINAEISKVEEDISPPGLAAINDYRTIAEDTRERTIDISEQITQLHRESEPFAWRLVTPDGTSQEIPLAEIVRAIPSNRLGTLGRLEVYFSRWREFLFAEPREANTEGGVFPAIWGTIAMTLIMTIAVVPFGVLAALYLREYAKAGIIVSAVRIAVNNLAGVPSIVFGVFGLGFFCYVVGAGIDETFYPEYVAQNKPVFGTGGLLWASLTLALLTLPVVIVATEEALAAVPNSMREGSYACGASKWQTIRRIILPRALPGIMTGMILAMARGAGEVAPLMLVGAVKIAPALPVDATAPFVHPSRSFMHLGFHIYDLGFQSPDSEAAKPMVFTTTLLLISIVAILNIAAIALRNRLRKRFAASQF